MTDVKFLRRKQAGEYIRSAYGFCSPGALAKLATVGGGPLYRKVHSGGRAPALYEQAALDEWAQSKIGAPRRSTSDVVEPA